MAKEKSSCLKKTLMGCGCFTLLFVVLGAGVGVMVAVNQPEPAEYEEFSLEQVVGDPEQRNLQFPGGDEPLPKPICLKVDLKKTRFTVAPDSTDGMVRVSGNYDKANFELETRIQEGENCVEYVVTLKDNSFFTSGDRLNDLVLHLPRNLPVDLELELAMGNLDMDLTGVPLASLNLETSMAGMHMRMASPNPIKAERFQVSTRMGSSRIEDIQNYHFDAGSLESSMGDMKIYNSGPLTMDTALELEMSMGEVYFQAPEGARLDSDFNCNMGEYKGPKQIKAGEDAPLLTLEGECSMGAVRVVTGKHKPLFTNVMYKVWLESGVDAAMDIYLTELKGDTENYRFGKHDLRSLGYRLLDSDHPEDALKIFELNATEYPDYHKTHRALAAANRKLGNLEKALDHLEDALDLEPSYNSAQKMKRQILRQLEKDREGEPH